MLDEMKDTNVKMENNLTCNEMNQATSQNQDTSSKRNVQQKRQRVLKKNTRDNKKESK